MPPKIPVFTAQQMTDWVASTGLQKKAVASDILGIRFQTLWTWMTGKTAVPPHAMRTIRFYEEAKALKRLVDVYGMLGLRLDPDQLDKKLGPE